MKSRIVPIPELVQESILSTATAPTGPACGAGDQDEIIVAVDPEKRPLAPPALSSGRPAVGEAVVAAVIQPPLGETQLELEQAAATRETPNDNHHAQLKDHYLQSDTLSHRSTRPADPLYLNRGVPLSSSRSAIFPYESAATLTAPSSDHTSLGGALGLLGGELGSSQFTLEGSAPHSSFRRSDDEMLDGDSGMSSFYD